MSNGRIHSDILASFFAGTDSDDDSARDPDVSIRSNETGGESFFDELSLASEDVMDIHGQGTGRDGDETNDKSDTSRARAARRAGDLPVNDRDERDQPVLCSTAAVAASGHAAACPTRNNPSGHVVNGPGGAADASISPVVPSQQHGTGGR